MDVRTNVWMHACFVHARMCPRLHVRVLVFAPHVHLSHVIHAHLSRTGASCGMQWMVMYRCAYVCRRVRACVWMSVRLFALVHVSISMYARRVMGSSR